MTGDFEGILDIPEQKVSALRKSVGDYLRGEVKDKGLETYWQLLTAEQAGYVAEIAKSNWGHYQTEFKDNWGGFVETTAQGWLESYRFFIGLMEACGYKPPSFQEPTGLGELDKSRIAILTVNSSVVLLGKGAVYSPAGAAIEYQRIPLRKGELINTNNINGGLSFDRGAKISQVPQIGVSWDIAFDKNVPLGRISPTPLLIYYRLSSVGQPDQTPPLKDIADSLTRRL